MKRNVRLVGFVLLLFFIFGTAVVFAVSENEAYTRGYREGYSKARSYTQDWQKPIQKSSAWLVFYAGLSQEEKLNSADLQYQFENGFEDGWADQKAGNRPAR
jgi:hypothetical protein